MGITCGRVFAYTGLSREEKRGPVFPAGGPGGPDRGEVLMAYSDRELLARLIQCEAVGGEYARVGQGSIRNIIFQPYQFVCASETEGGAYNPQNIYNMRPEQIHYDIADWAIAGNRIPDVAESLWFYNPFGPKCRSRFPSDVGYWQTRIGDHCFYNPTDAYYKT